MQAEDRPIHFSTELLHRPARHKTQALQKLYFELSQTTHGSYANTDLNVPGQPKFHTKRPPKTQSIAVFLPDRILLIEEWVDTTFSDFLQRVETVAEYAMRDLEIAEFGAQTATVRTTFALTHFADARKFMMEQVCNLGGRFGPCFDRPLSVGGLRFVFPAVPGHPGDIHVTMEPFRRSQDEIYAEAKGVYLKRRIDRENLSTTRNALQDVRSFINEHVFHFLNQFDVPDESE